MAQNMFFEDVQVGAELPGLTANPTTESLVRYAAAADDYSRLHYDDAYAHMRGFTGVIVHGLFKAACSARQLGDWGGPQSWVKRMVTQYKSMDYPYHDMSCFGKVAGKYVRDGKAYAELEIWTQNDQGKITTSGAALVQLPARGTDGPAYDSAASLFSDGAPKARAEVPNSIITDEMRDSLKIGKVSGEFRFTVDKRWVDRFATAYGDANPVWRDEKYAAAEGLFGGIIAPPSFWAAMDPVETRVLLLEDWMDRIPYKRSGGGNAVNEVEYFLPIRLNDTITVSTTYKEIYEKEGRSGRLLFRARENDLVNGKGELVAKTRLSHVMSFDLARNQ
jgi:acyl dehydratase